MYTVPAKTNVQARSLIRAIETGEFRSLQPVLDGEDAENSNRQRQPHPELSPVELAEPGTAKKLLLAFEQMKSQESVTSPTTPGSGSRSLSSSGRGRLNPDRLSGFENRPFTDEEATAAVEAVRSALSAAAVTNVVMNGADDGGHLRHSDASVTTVTTSVGKDDAKNSVIQTTACLTSADVNHFTVSQNEPSSAASCTDGTDGGQVASVVKTDEPIPASHSLPTSSSSHFSAVAETTAGQQRRRTVLLVTAFKRGETPLDVALRDVTVRKVTEGTSDEVIVTDACCIARDHFGNENYSEELEKLLQSDLVIFQFRTVLNTIPAALKAWLENVLTDNRCGNLRGKKAVLLVTTDVDQAAHDPKVGSLGDIGSYISPIQTGILSFVSFDVLAPQLFFGADNFVQDQQRDIIIDQWASRLASLWTETGI